MFLNKKRVQDARELDQKRALMVVIYAGFAYLEKFRYSSACLGRHKKRVGIHMHNGRFIRSGSTNSEKRLCR